MIELSVIDHPDQRFSVILEGRRVTMRLRYNVTSDRWSFDLSIDDEPVVHGRRVVTGIDLLAPFQLGVGAIFALDHGGEGRQRDRLPRRTIRLYQASLEELA